MPDRAMTTKLIAAAARESLQPLGLRRKGRSRLWFTDHGWWLNLVEFTPARRDGTYLVVGARWLWYENDVWTVDDGGRIYWRRDATFCSQPPLGETGWTDVLGFTTVDHFTRDIAMLAEIAGQRVAQLRAEFSDPTATARRLANRSTRLAESPLWHAYHTGAAAGLSRDATTAREAFGRITPDSLEPDWAHDLAHQARLLAELADHPAELQLRILELVQATRQRLTLPPLDPDQLINSSAGRLSS